MVRLTNEANSSKEISSRIHWELRAETPMRCESEGPRTIAVTPRFRWFHVSAKCVSQGRSATGKVRAGVTLMTNMSSYDGETLRWTFSRWGTAPKRALTTQKYSPS